MQPDLIADRYRVVRAVGQGGMGKVWLCMDETLHRQVAVKQIGSLPGESPRDTARAMREARLSAALVHKNAVSIYDVVEHDGMTWLVMEYVASQTLSQLIAADGRLTPGRVAHIGAQVAAALSSAHALGIIHRDIKPGNILVGDDDAAKISDFGIARGHQDVRLTQTGMVTGTPAFFAPELARGEDPSFASDVWALGITLYTATEGAPPYEPQSNPLAMLSTIARDPLPPPSHAGPLTDVLAGMLQRDATQRATMAEALTGLRDVDEQDGAMRSPWDTAILTADTGSAPAQPDPTTTLETPVEPAYERAVTVPAVSNGWSDARVDDDLPRSRERRTAGWLTVAVLALLVLLGAGALLWNTLGLGNHDNTGTAVNPPASSGQQTQPGTDSTQAGTKHPPTKSTDTQPTTPPSSTALTSTSTGTTNPPTASSAVDFTRSYYTIVPGDLDTGWSLLAPSFQQRFGRASYDSFWNSIASVDVRNVVAVNPETVRYQITYTRTDGSQPTENKQLTLQRNGGSYLITGDAGIG